VGCEADLSAFGNWSDISGRGLQPVGTARRSDYTQSLLDTVHVDVVAALSCRGKGISHWGLGPKQRTHDAITEIHSYRSRFYGCVFAADIKLCFDTIDHVALMGSARRRVGDKRDLTLVKSFSKSEDRAETWK
jgi:hypothetical protein